MRELKFRAWDIEKKQFVNDDFYLQERVVKLDYQTNYLMRPCIYELSQYTCLIDKNGNEIYEGDIIHLFGNDYHEGVDYNGCIQFLDGGFCATDGYEEYGLRRYDLSRCDLEIEVIGNIYENHELLEG